MKVIRIVIPLLAVILSLDYVSGEYSCLCNYNVELNVYEQSSVDSEQVGFMYEFDCKPLVTDVKIPGWFVIAYQNQMRYVADAPNTDVQLCVGSIPRQDAITTTPSPSTTTTTANVTLSTSPTTTIQVTSSTLPTTTTKVTSSTMPTTTTTQVTSSTAPTTTTTKVTSSTMPTTTTTQVTSSTAPTTTTQVTSTMSSSTTEVLSTTIQTKTTQMPSSTISNEITDMTSSTLPTTTTKASVTTMQTTITSQTPNTATESTQSSKTAQVTSPTTSSTSTMMTSPTSTSTKMTSPATSSTTTMVTSPATSSTTTMMTSSTTTSTTERMTSPTSSTTTSTNSPTVLTSHKSTIVSSTIQSTTQSTSTTKTEGADVCPEIVLASANTNSTTIVRSDTVCYEVVQNLTSWANGEKHCKQNGGHLIHIASKNEQDFIYNYLASIKSHTIWIGLHKLNNETNFKWISGEPVTYTNWIQNFRPIGRMVDCVYITPSGEWKDTNCDETGYHHGFVCQYESSIPFTTGKPLHGTDLCPKEVIEASRSSGTTLAQFENHCYEVSQNLTWWLKAETQCIQNGGHLAYIADQKEQDFIYNYLASIQSHTVWIGLHDRNNEAKFEWTSGNSVSYTNWGSHHTSYNTASDCTYITTNGSWKDTSCNKTGFYYGYICKYDIRLKMAADGDTDLCPDYVRHLVNQENTTLGYFNGSCWALVSTPMTWPHADGVCHSRYGDLATIASHKEQDFVFNFMSRHTNRTRVWIGLNDMNNEGHFRWSSGSHSQYTNWDPAHHGNQRGEEEEDCVTMNLKLNGLWDDIPCGNFAGNSDHGWKCPSLCQYKASSVG